MTIKVVTLAALHKDGERYRKAPSPPNHPQPRRQHRFRFALLPGHEVEKTMSDEDPNKVWPTGLTVKEAEEIHSQLIDGTRVFGAIALVAHLLVAVSTPWLG